MGGHGALKVMNRQPRHSSLYNSSYLIRYYLDIFASMLQVAASGRSDPLSNSSIPPQRCMNKHLRLSEGNKRCLTRKWSHTNAKARCSADGEQQSSMDSSDEELHWPPFKKIRIQHRSKLAESDSEVGAEPVSLELEPQTHSNSSEHNGLVKVLLATGQHDHKQLHSHVGNAVMADAVLVNNKDLGTHLDSLSTEIVMPYKIPELGMGFLHLDCSLLKA